MRYGLHIALSLVTAWLLLAPTPAHAEATVYDPSTLNEGQLGDWAEAWASCVAAGGSPEECAGNPAAAGVGDQINNALNNSFFNPPTTAPPLAGVPNPGDGAVYNQAGVRNCMQQYWDANPHQDPVGAAQVLSNCGQGVAKTPSANNGEWVNPYGP